MQLQYESNILTIDGENVHVTRVFKDAGHPVVFVHGSIENGKIFYTRSGKGIAPFLAEHGLDCYVIDLPGRGLSTPTIRKHSAHDLPFYIEKVIPQAIEFAKKRSQSNRVSVVAHSWGGVLLLTMIAIRSAPDIASMVFFGSKRRISIRSLKKKIMVDVFWRFIGTRLSSVYGFYPAKQFRMGSDNETTSSFLQTDRWVQDKEWEYFNDRRDIAATLQQIVLPPLLSITGSSDDVLGHPLDVKALLDETGKHQRNEFLVAGKRSGFSQDYGHIDILTSPSAPTEIFPLALAWIRKINP